jgi:hypothetical protein
MDFKYQEGIPKGRLLPVYLTEEGDLLPVLFKNTEELDLCEQLISIALSHRVILDPANKLNNPNDRFSIGNYLIKKEQK